MNPLDFPRGETFASSRVRDFDLVFDKLPDDIVMLWPQRNFRAFDVDGNEVPL